MVKHSIMGGKVHVYRRGSSSNWHCSTYLKGRNHRKSTNEDSLDHAKQIAEDWYFELRGKARAGLIEKKEMTFERAASIFLEEYPIITEGHRSKEWTKGYEIRIRRHLNPFFGKMGVSQIHDGTIVDYEIHRIKTSPDGKRPARSTLHDEVVTVRQVLKTAMRRKALSHVPDLTPPHRKRSKVVHRPWFSPEEYKQLYKATGEYAKTVVGRHQWNAEQVHDYVLFMANTGLRPDEAKNLQHRDVVIARDDATRETILEIEVRGKRGVGFCKSMPGAARVYERLKSRPFPDPPKDRSKNRRKKPMAEETPPKEMKVPQPTDLVFPGNHIKLFNGVLTRSNLKLDRDGNRRTAYSLRHTYICMRLMDGADIYQVAKNCRTSVEMIQEFYAAHIKDTLDAAAINVRRKKHRAAAKSSGSGEADES